MALAAIAGFAIAGCGGSGSYGRTPSATASPAAAASATLSAEEQATAAASSAAAQLTLIGEGDLPAEFAQRQDQVKLLSLGEVPGMQSPASGRFATYVTADGDDFVTTIGVVPDDPASLDAMLQAFTPANYLFGFTSGARDATSEPLALPDAPTGARAMRYGGTTTGGGATRPIAGEAVAFTRGNAYIILIHGSYRPTPAQIALGTLAGRIAGRLDAPPALH